MFIKLHYNVFPKVPSNVFIRNLALTDLLIGFLIFPVLTLTLAQGRDWSLTTAVCLIHGVMVRSNSVYCLGLAWAVVLRSEPLDTDYFNFCDESS